MPNRKASAVWEGGLKGGKGTFKGESGCVNGEYSFSSRFEEGDRARIRKSCWPPRTRRVSAWR